MKLRILVIAVAAALGAACAGPDSRRSDLDVKPVLAVRHSAQDAQAYYRLGRYYHGQNRLAQAEEAYVKATSLDARHVDAHNALASLYAERGELARAEKAFQALSEMAPAAAHVYNNLGYTRWLLGRRDEAYAALRQAVRLDDKLARAWSHLQRLADQQPQAGLTEALTARRADRLPDSLHAAESTALAAAAGPTAAAPLAPVAHVVSAAAASAAPVASMASVSPPPAAPPLTPGPSIAAAALAVPNATPTTVTKAPASVMAVPPPPLSANAPALATEGGRVDGKSGFLLVSAAGEAALTRPAGAVDLSAVRIEVSNGNGVARFARKFSARLRAAQIPVSRLTNLGHFRLRESVIEYQAGHEAAARALTDHLGGTVRVAAARHPRPRSDIRIMLGRDALAL